MTETTNRPAAAAARVKKQGMLIMIASVLALAGIVGSIYFFKKYNDIKENPTAEIEQKNQEESDRVLSKLTEIIVFNEENPTVARIEDPAVLQSSNPDFYKNAQTGDYLVLFPSRAIVYREADNKIINLAPIINTQNINGQTSATPADDTTTTDETNNQ